jgi:translation elongation factor EF-Ts
MRVLRKDLLEIKNDENIKEKIVNTYLDDFIDYDNNFYKLLSSQIFSREELKNIEERLEKTPLKIFQNTY